MAEAKITWLGHAAFQIAAPDGQVALIDPFLTQNPACPETLRSPRRVDLIVLTHGHFDHVGDTVALAQRFACPVVGIVELCSLLEADLPDGLTRPMNHGGTQTVAGFEVTLTRAFHSSSYPVDGKPMYAGQPAGVVLRAPGCAPFYHAGDTDVFGDMNLIAALWRPQIAALPIGGHYTMGPKGAALAVELLGKPASVIPIHHGTWPVIGGSVEQFQSELSQRGVAREVNVRALRPGESLDWPPASA